MPASRGNWRVLVAQATERGEGRTAYWDEQLATSPVESGVDTVRPAPVSIQGDIDDTSEEYMVMGASVTGNLPFEAACAEVKGEY